MLVSTKTPEFYSDKQQVRRSFAAAATQYDAAAVLQQEVVRRMLERLAVFNIQPQRVLDLGSGTGYGSELLQQRYPKAQVLELDFALPMLLAARQREAQWRRWTQRWQRLRLCADVEALPVASAQADLLWSSLCFQWLNQPDQAFAEAARVLRPGGVLFFSSMGPDTLKELRAAFAAVEAESASAAGHVNQFIDMHDLGDALLRAGLSNPVMEMEHITLTYQDLKAVLHDLKSIGAHHAAQGRARGMMGRKKWMRLQQAYERFRQQGRLPATFEVIYGHAWKASAAPAAAAGGTQVIQFHRPGARP